MKLSPITTTILVVLLLWLILPSFEASVGDFTIALNTVFAFFIGGVAGGLRFAYLKSRRMSARETAFHAVFSYVVATAIPLALFLGMVYVARDMPAIAELREEHIPATDVLGFLAGYFAVDAVPSLLALCAALFVSRMRPAEL